MTRRMWTACEVDLLRSMYPECHTDDVAAWIGRSTSQCYQGAARFGLNKSAEYLASDTACRIRRGKQHPSMIASRFKAGQDAWNKGLRGVVGVQEACRATQFKKGVRPHTWMPIGSYRISSEGVLEQKLTDEPGPNSVRWFPVHRTLWVGANGPIPPGHVVRFKPGQKTTDLALITLERLECVTRMENMRRNSLHTIYPPEVAHLVQLRGALNRQINARTRAAEQA